MAQAAGVSPTHTGAQESQPRTKGSVMATTVIGAHAFEHLYAHSIPVLILAISTELGLGALQVGVVVAVRSIFGGLPAPPAGFWLTFFTTG